MLRKHLLPALLTLGLLLQTSPAPLHALTLGPAGLTPVSLAAGGVSPQPPAQADFDQDGSPERLVLVSGLLAIFSNSAPVWQSPAGWTVLQAQVTDLDHDGIPEATMLVWRPFRPWPVDQWLPHGGRIASFHDSSGDSCHIILVGWRNGRYRAVWAGSAMAEPVRSFAVADLNGTGRQYLVTLEGSYAEPRSAPARVLKVWEWNGFGFSVVSAMQGTFDKLALIRANPEPVLILVP